jgi:hypothetical protein
MRKSISFSSNRKQPSRTRVLNRGKRFGIGSCIYKESGSRTWGLMFEVGQILVRQVIAESSR